MPVQLPASLRNSRAAQEIATKASNAMKRANAARSELNSPTRVFWEGGSGFVGAAGAAVLDEYAPALPMPNGMEVPPSLIVGGITVGGALASGSVMVANIARGMIDPHVYNWTRAMIQARRAK